MQKKILTLLLIILLLNSCTYLYKDSTFIIDCENKIDNKMYYEIAEYLDTTKTKYEYYLFENGNSLNFLQGDNQSEKDWFYGNIDFKFPKDEWRAFMDYDKIKRIKVFPEIIKFEFVISPSHADLQLVYFRTNLATYNQNGDIFIRKELECSSCGENWLFPINDKWAVQSTSK